MSMRGRMFQNKHSHCKGPVLEAYPLGLFSREPGHCGWSRLRRKRVGDGDRRIRRSRLVCVTRVSHWKHMDFYAE